MQKIGSALALLLAAPALGQVEFYQSVDRSEVGTEDTFQLTVVITNAPDGAQLKLPSSNDFETLSRSQSTQMSYQMGFGQGGASMKRTQVYTLVMRANRAGVITIPPSILEAGGRQLEKTEAIRVTVTKGRASAPPPPPSPKKQRGMIQTPFGAFPGFPDMDDEDLGPGNVFGIPEPQVPRSESDLFLRAALDKEEAFVGEQVTYSLTIYSRVDLSSVESVLMPKFEGFWTEDLDTPTQLAPEQKILNGVPYRAYLLRRRALFAVKPGTMSVGAAEADIVTGFLFAGSKVHRKGPALSLKIKPLPPGNDTQNVGRWKLSLDSTKTSVALGEPVQVKVTLEGRGNLKNLALAPLTGPEKLKIYEPTTTDKVTNTRGTLGGRRTLEYVIVPQATGTWTVPGLKFDFFNPDTEKFETSTTPDLTLVVGSGNPTAPGGVGSAVVDSGPRNRLEAGGLKLLRHSPRFDSNAMPVWQRPYFLPLIASPWALLLLGAVVGGLRRLGGTDSAASRRKLLAKEARTRLATAEKLVTSQDASGFYVEIEKALYAFVEAHLNVSAFGLTRAALDEKMKEAVVHHEARTKILSVLETCDLGRYAPGMGEVSARKKALSDAAAAMEAWAQ